MRILCYLCAPPDNVLGEKCSRCGNADLFALDNPSIFEIAGGYIMINRPRFICWPCRFVFPAGQGGDSHTLCPMHAAQARLSRDEVRDAAAGLPPKEVS